MKFLKKESEKIEDYLFEVISILSKHIAAWDKSFEENVQKIVIVFVTCERISIEDHPKNFEIVGKVIFDVRLFIDHF